MRTYLALCVPPIHSAASADLKKLVDLEILDFTNDEDTATALKYARIIEALDPEMPVVLSHGTNVMPEVAFLLDLVLDRPAPVVVTGSMRPISSVRHACIKRGSLTLTRC